LNQLNALRDLVAHMEWADAEMWRAVLGGEEASTDEFTLATLHHLHMTQRAFLDVWSGRSVVIRERSDFGSALPLRDEARSHYPLIRQFLESVSPDALDGAVVVPWSKYFTGASGQAALPATLGETIQQVAAHSTYHRGQVNRRIREVGGQPPLVDYIAWIWMGRPMTVWEKGAGGGEDSP